MMIFGKRVPDDHNDTPAQCRSIVAEYVLIVALVAIAVIAGLGLLGS